MKKSILSTLSIILLSLLFTSCLTVEKKEYTFQFKDNNSGTLTIKFINLLSMKDDTADVSDQDYEELINSYINGNQIESDYENATVRSKRLFEEDGVLCGEVIIDFENISSVGLYQYEAKGPFMLNVGSFLEGESFLTSNGEYGGEIMPVVFWSRSNEILNLTTYVTSPDETTIGLLPMYKKQK
jgi:sporulation protein YlmC with PRC-barrel domain